LLPIRAPTPPIYAILCEQDELLDYLLMIKRPNLEIRTGGWTALHYAACTGSHKCLELLLKYELIQENIDCPIDDIAHDPPPDWRTTALHIAATKGRHVAALLLTQPFPPPECDAKWERIPKWDAVHEPANALQMTAHWNMPLHISARQNDWDLCQIILHASDDPTVRNGQGKVPAAIAREFGFEN
jgi:ankyrin repeat protein